MRAGTNTFLTGTALGAGMMYMLDPTRGKRRRALLRDKAVHAEHELGATAGKTFRDLRYRAQGIIAEIRSGLTRAREVEDEVLVARVRSALGRVVAHPASIAVTCSGGSVFLSGDVLQGEADQLIETVRGVEGVRSVSNWLHSWHSAEHISALQGGRPRTGRQSELWQKRWSPTTQLFVGVAGSLLSLYSIRKRGLTGIAAGTAGACLLARSVFNRELAAIFGLKRDEGIRVQKTIHIEAPAPELFEFWANPQNYSLVMEHVKKVEKVGDNLYHWTVAGPAGLSVGWDGEIIATIPNRLVAWRSTPRSLVGNAGKVEFETEADGRARVQIQMTYEPPVGLVGHFIAELFGSDPKHVLDEDLARFKSLFENGKTRVRGEIVTREQLSSPVAHGRFRLGSAS